MNVASFYDTGLYNAVCEPTFRRIISFLFLGSEINKAETMTLLS
jgi:hypothetical protein